VKAVLACHKSGDDEDGALIAEDGFTDACDAGSDGKTSVPFESSHHRTGVAYSNQKRLMRGKAF
jgi:hypothetical protein